MPVENKKRLVAVCPLAVKQLENSSKRPRFLDTRRIEQTTTFQRNEPAEWKLQSAMAPLSLSLPAQRLILSSISRRMQSELRESSTNTGEREFNFWPSGNRECSSLPALFEGNGDRSWWGRATTGARGKTAPVPDEMKLHPELKLKIWKSFGKSSRRRWKKPPPPSHYGNGSPFTVVKAL